MLNDLRHLYEEHEILTVNLFDLQIMQEKLGLAKPTNSFVNLMANLCKIPHSKEVRNTKWHKK